MMVVVAESRKAVESWLTRETR